MNFNPPMCKAGKICIAEVEEVVDINEIPPGQVNMHPVDLRLVLRLTDYILHFLTPIL